MQNDLALVVPAAGRGSRFFKLGICEPKPLIELQGKPFFWWATESVRRSVKLREIIYVVLEEHIAEFEIDKRIKSYYPDAKVVAIPDVTSGAAETAKIGIDALTTSGPVAINDCDHAFMCELLHGTVSDLQNDLAGALMCFRSADPAYSYIKFNDRREIIGTVEKQVVSPFAIAGCYLFADPLLYLKFYEQYRQDCPYNELYISGLFNLMAKQHLSIGKLEVQRHVSFGTPEEQRRVNSTLFAPFLNWK